MPSASSNVRPFTIWYSDLLGLLKLKGLQHSAINCHAKQVESAVHLCVLLNVVTVTMAKALETYSIR